MSPQLLRTLAIFNVGFVAAMAALCVAFAVVVSLRGEPSSFFWQQVPFLPVVLLLAGLGALILARRPGHLIGIGMCIEAALVGIMLLVGNYAEYGIDTNPGSVPYADEAAWFDDWSWIPGVVPLLTYLFLLCPDGRLLSPQWRGVVLLVTLNLVVLSLALALNPGPLDSRPAIENPFGIQAIKPIIGWVRYTAFMALIPTILICAASMVLRFRRSNGLERQQLKWFASAAAASGALFFGAFIVTAFFDGADAAWDPIIPLLFVLVILASSIAILRYRLYDIDRIINRTLVYGLLTAVLAMLYFGLVVALQEVSKPLSGNSDLAIALTTLIVAALFLPVRRRVQALVDRRFNRRAYDAAKTLDAFGARLRQNIDLDTLRYELMAVVDETMEPSKVSVWLRTARP